MGRSASPILVLSMLLRATRWRGQQSRSGNGTGMWRHLGREKLCATARQVSDWDGEAVVKLNIWIRRRVEQPRRCAVKTMRCFAELDENFAK